MTDLERLQAVNIAIWMRDNCGIVPHNEIRDAISNLAKYNLFSNRQIYYILQESISHSAIARQTQKKDKSGGKLSPKSLEDIREFIFTKNYEAAARAIKLGTSQNVLSKISGTPQSSLSRKIKK